MAVVAVGARAPRLRAVAVRDSAAVVLVAALAVRVAAPRMAARLGRAFVGRSALGALGTPLAGVVGRAYKCACGEAVGIIVPLARASVAVGAVRRFNPNVDKVLPRSTVGLAAVEILVVPRRAVAPSPTPLRCDVVGSYPARVVPLAIARRARHVGARGHDRGVVLLGVDRGEVDVVLAAVVACRVPVRRPVDENEVSARHDEGREHEQQLHVTREWATKMATRRK